MTRWSGPAATIDRLGITVVRAQLGHNRFRMPHWSAVLAGSPLGRYPRSDGDRNPGSASRQHTVISDTAAQPGDASLTGCSPGCVGRSV
jgi:hypothetical protein